MSDTFKVLAQGQLPNSAATIYTAVGPTIVKFVALNNGSANNGESWKLYINGTAATNLWASGTLDTLQDSEWQGTLSLANGNTIAGVTTDATSVTFTISGDENIS